MFNLATLQQVFAKHPALMHECYGHFSQGGEDIVVSNLLAKETTKGKFVDIGAYHPFRFSNTFLLYLQGWRGVNVDANPAAIDLFKQARPDDLSFQALVSDKVEQIRYFRFEEGAWNTTNPAVVELLANRGQAGTKLIGEETYTTQTVNSILEQHVGTGKFDFLNIDVEGLDERIFFSIDFKRFRPKVIAIEIGIDAWNAEPMKSFLEQQGYQPHSQCYLSAILLRRD